MRLKELEIQGFKSFPDKTKIEIGEGITGVVGPNGSGKSNISDSIRWVLGETSSKQLRGSGKMEDVIFGGTQSRGAMGYASVALTIDNSDHGLDMDADEVTIGRRYYRSGESEYSINGQNVRLKDVYELLLDTGIGRDGYAIVGQGRIAEIVGAKSAERREIFEEASGIAKYRYRKNEAERRLDAAEGNLERLRDILGELEKRVGPLKRDSEKAQQFLELSEKRKTLEITLWVDAIRRANDSLRDQQRKYEAAQADYDRLSRQLDEFDEKSASLRAEAQQLVLAVEQANADIRAITEANAGSESEIAVLKNELHVPFVINQNRYSIFDRTIEQNGLKKTAVRLNKGIIAFSPLAQGLLTNRYLNGIPEDSRVRTDGRFLKESALTEEKLAQIRALNEIAASRGQTLAEMALAWVLKDGEVTSVLIGASRPEQILDNIKALENTTFTKEELEAIDKASGFAK